MTAAQAAPAPRVSDERIEEVCRRILDAWDPDLVPHQGASWPEHEDDDGYRGGGYVRLQPADVRARMRDFARRVIMIMESVEARENYAEIARLNARLATAERERNEALEEHTDMTWQRRRADERAEAAEARLATAERDALLEAADMVCSSVVPTTPLEVAYVHGILAKALRAAADAVKTEGA